ncbi:MAG TPA: hypothetical protein VMC84_06625 [Methanocella sp.]|nr:hypothetical protein [Methanocella sp.]HTY90835.1 hypothetical protein [Methanocella sp.]
MPKWVCEVCGYEHRFLCRPGCEAFQHHGTCCPKECPKCKAPGSKFHME